MSAGRELVEMVKRPARPMPRTKWRKYKPRAMHVVNPPDRVWGMPWWYEEFVP